MMLMRVYGMKHERPDTARWLEDLAEETPKLGVCLRLDFLLSWLDSTVVQIGIGGTHKARSLHDLVSDPRDKQDTKTWSKS
jgi:hypothetical protein